MTTSESTETATDSCGSDPDTRRIQVGKVSNPRMLANVNSPSTSAKVRNAALSTDVRSTGSTTETRTRGQEAPRLRAASVSVRRSVPRRPASSAR